MADSPELSSIVGFLNHLSIDELKDVLNDDIKFEEITKDTSNKMKMNGNSEKEMLQASNRSIAEYMQLTAENLQVQIIELAELYETLEIEGQKYNSVLSQIRDRANTTDATTMLTLLQTAATQLEADTDALSEKFLNSEVTMDEFVDEYLNSRKLMYVRKSKIERLNEIKNKRSSYRSAPPPPATASSTRPQSSIYSIPSYGLPQMGPPPFSQSTSQYIPYPIGGPVRMPTPSSYIPNHF